MPLVARTMPVTVAGAAALLGLLAVINPMLAVIGSIGLSFVAVMLADLAVGLCLFAFSAALFEAIPEFGSISVAKAIGLALALSWIAALALRTSLRGELFSALPGFTWLLVLLGTWSVASVLWAEDPSTVVASCLRLVLSLLLVPIAFAAVTDARRLRWLIGSLLAGVLCSTIYGLVIAPADLEAAGRLGGAGLDPNYLALFLAVAGTLALGLAARRATPSPVRWLLLGAIGLTWLSLLATGSRTGLVALGAVLLAAPFLAGRRRRGLVAVVAVLAAAGAGLYFTSFASDTVREHVAETQGGGSGRTDIWRVGWRMVGANPVLGVGLGNFQDASIHYLLVPGAIKRSDYIVDHPKAAHNLYLEVLAELGAVGLGLYLAIAGFALMAAQRAAVIFERLGLRDEEVLARAVLLATVGLVGGSFFVSVQYTKPLWLLLALGPTVLGLARRARASAARA